MKRIIDIAAVVIIAMVCLCGCSAGFVNGSAVKYDNADKYTAGDREITDKIDSLDIDWVSGSVKVTAGGSNVSVKETTKGELEDKYKVHTWAEGRTLHVRFCKSGERYDGSEPKTLEITVPADILYEDIRADASSADIEFEGVNSKKTVMDASSGNMTYKGDAESFTADTSSGKISFTGKAADIHTDSSSGGVFIRQDGEADSISVDTSSGDIEIDSDYTASLKADSSSGDKVITLRKMPKKVHLDSSSGGVKLYLPEDADFTANIDTSSGEVDYEFAMSKTGDETYTCGSGENKLEINTSSGNVKLLKI